MFNFNNIGRKIMTTAKFLFVIEVIGCLLIGSTFLLSEEEAFVIAGIHLVLLGPFLTWLASSILYGFGHLIDNSDRLVAMAVKSSGYDPETSTDYNLSTLDKWKAEGLISQEEYKAKRYSLEDDAQ